MIEFTEAAKNRMKVILETSNLILPTAGIRIGIVGGGCSGFTYKILTTDAPNDKDTTYTFEDLNVYVDPKSLSLLDGMKLDFETTLMRQGFNFINPNARKTCGCGSSFST